jgi:hypothetical protein
MAVKFYQSTMVEKQAYRDAWEGQSWQIETDAWEAKARKADSRKRDTWTSNCYWSIGSIDEPKWQRSGVVDIDKIWGSY